MIKKGDFVKRVGAYIVPDEVRQDRIDRGLPILKEPVPGEIYKVVDSDGVEIKLKGLPTWYSASKFIVVIEK